jgi:hypothetical protein
MIDVVDHCQAALGKGVALLLKSQRLLPYFLQKRRQGAHGVLP